MGKNSLLKSTSKAKKKSTAKKKAAAKAAPKAKKAPAVKTKKTAPKTTQKKVSVKDLIMKKFGVWKPETLYTVRPDETDSKDSAAPPFFSGSEEETRRIKELLLKKFDLAEIKAAAEKAAAEKAAAEKAVEPEVSVSYEPPDSGGTITDDPMEKAMKYLVAAFAVLIALVIGSSMINKNKFYIHATDGALEIWQGRFAPMGEACLISLPGVQPPETIKNIYSKADAFPLIFNYYVEKADTLLIVPGLPDFAGIKTYLNKALAYATTPAANEAVFSRLNNIELMILLYKADVSASKPTLSDLNQAKGFLSEAARLGIDDLKVDLIHQKMDAVDQQIAALKAKQAAEKSSAKPAK
jgi:colicin import membrane protein